MKQPSRIFRGKVGQGKLWIEGGRAQLDEYIKRFEGKDVEVIVRKLRRKRTLKQNGWYWGCIIPMIQEASGYETAEETHDALKWHFLQVHTGPLPTVRSTRSMDTVDMVEYCENCRRLGSKMFGIDIPDPKRAEEMGFCISE